MALNSFTCTLATEHLLHSLFEKIFTEAGKFFTNHAPNHQNMFLIHILNPKP